MTTLTKQSLAETHPHLIDEWHPTKNGDLTPTPEEVKKYESMRQKIIERLKKFRSANSSLGR